MTKKRKLLSYLALSGFLLCSEIFAMKVNKIPLTCTHSCSEIHLTSRTQGIPPSPRFASDEPFPHPLPQEQQQINIISFSGGGIRGIIPALMVDKFEEYSQAPLYKSFHMMAGTSTGAILAAALSADRNVYQRPIEYNLFENCINTATCGFYGWWNPSLHAVHKENYHLRNDTGRHLYLAKDIIDIYKKNANVIFSRTYLNRFSYGMLGARYCDYGRLNVFNSFFNNLTLKDSLSDLLIPYYNLDTSSTNFFKTVHAWRQTKPRDYYIKDVLMATTAAPTYFNPYFVRSIQQIEARKTEGTSCADGGIGGANDPTIFALCEALKRYPDAQTYFILSLGTGEWDRHPIRAHHLWEWGSELSNTLISAPQDVNLYVMERLVGALNKRVIFQRLDVRIDCEHSRMDDISSENIDALDKYVRENVEIDTKIREIHDRYIRGHMRNID